MSGDIFGCTIGVEEQSAGICGAERPEMPYRTGPPTKAVQAQNVNAAEVE